MRLRILLGVLLLALGLVTACEPEGSIQEGEDTPTEVTTDDGEMADDEAEDGSDDGDVAEVEEIMITATDDGFELPETVEAGLKRFVLVSETEALVQAQIIKLDGDYTADDVMDWLASMPPMEEGGDAMGEEGEAMTGEGEGDEATSEEGEDAATGEGEDATSEEGDDAMTEEGEDAASEEGEDAMTDDAMAEEGFSVPDWMTMWGGPNPPPPGGSSDAYVELEPGNYAVASMIPGPDGQLGAAKGYLAGFEVVEAEAEDMAQAPAPDVTIEGVDFAFSGGRFGAPGDYVVNFENAGEQDHEIVFVELDGDATPMDFIEAVGSGTEGPPPGIIHGGIVALPPGEAQAFTLSLEPGRYAAICFLEDPETGQPHFALGMLREYEIEE